MQTIKKIVGDFGRSISEWYITTLFSDHPVFALFLIALLKTAAAKLKTWLVKSVVKEVVIALFIVNFLKLFKKYIPGKIVLVLHIILILIDISVRRQKETEDSKVLV